MTGPELEQCLNTIGWSKRQVQQRFGWPEHTVLRMIRGENPVSPSLAIWATVLSAVVEALGTPALE